MVRAPQHPALRDGAADPAMSKAHRRVLIEVDTVMVGNREVLDPATVKVMVMEKPGEPTSTAHLVAQLDSVEFNYSRARRHGGRFDAAITVMAEDHRIGAVDDETQRIVDASSANITIDDVRGLLR